MDLNSKQRAYLRFLAQTEEAILTIGKDGLTPEVTSAVEEAFTNRELIKVSVNKNCAEDIRALLQTLSERTRALPVFTIGRKMVLYRAFRENPVLDKELRKLTQKSKQE